MTLRLIAGKYKGRILKAPKTNSTRPTQGVVREAVFNICQNEIESADFLDLFAGSGAMGLEALSRGAAHAVFVEQNRNAIICIKQNIAELQVENETDLLAMPAIKALSLLAKNGTRFDIVYIDPPYDKPIQPILDALPSILKPDALVFVEEREKGKSLYETSLLKCFDSRRFGIAVIHQYRLQLPT